MFILFPFVLFFYNGKRNQGQETYKIEKKKPDSTDNTEHTSSIINQSKVIDAGFAYHVQVDHHRLLYKFTPRYKDCCFILLKRGEK